MKNLYFYASCIHNPDTLSGGDRIFIELARQWKKKANITIITSPEGKELCKKYYLNLDYIVITHKAGDIAKLASLFLKRLFSGIKFAFKTNLEPGFIYSTSNFISDSFPSSILKLRTNSVWIAGYYLEPPNPFYGYDESKTKIKFPGFSDLAFWVQDKLSKFLIKHFADIIYVTSQPDAEKFPNKKKVIIKGGVDTHLPEKIKNSKNPEFDSVFIGRFHQEKGVLELIDIWKLVMSKNPGSKLAMIGNGPLEKAVKDKIKKLRLEKNIILFGFKDGLEKIKIFKNSKIVLHPARYDSGGMAAAEAMACKLPGVSYDLEALKTYYPQGMLKTKIGNKEQFAENILLLLKDKKLYNKLSKQAYELAKEWSWPERAEEIHGQTFRNHI